MTDIEILAKKVLENLINNNVSPTPNQYHKEFCKLSKNLDKKIDECELFTKLVSKLDRKSVV